ncbi:hypothetical protein BDC45DRAFT_492974 [Circinella umbellata]|nr:hypothetical protein BDC45DRAFT_492974 [Circinella umbellata]
MTPRDCSSDSAQCDQLQSTPSPTPSGINCTACQQPLDGEFVRALDGMFHWSCFSCLDCNKPVASRFFPINHDGRQRPLCERDYFRRLNLVCESCGEALRGPYITAVGKKFHLEHFCCHACSVVLGPSDSYYEHENNVYCHYHYSVKFAIKCSGCRTAILKQFVEINRNNVDEHWHPECYMIHKFWNVKVAQSLDNNNNNNDDNNNKDLVHQDQDVSKMTMDELRDAQVAMEDKVYRIWTVLSAFEESAAACISDMLLHVSGGSYLEGLRMADYFVTHVEVLFGAIDDLVLQYHAQSNAELQHERESRLLCKKIINFFSLLSQTQETGLRRMGITEELLSLVTGLAHYLKVLIRISLTGALRLETKQDKSSAISRFLSQLVESANKQRYTSAELDSPLTSDACHFCQKTCDDECFKHHHKRWHDKCFACSKCCIPLRDEFKDTYWDPKESVLLCSHCGKSTLGFEQGFEHVSQLQQFSFLLRYSHRRLYILLNVSVDGTNNKSTQDPILGNTPPGRLTHESRTKSHSEGEKLQEKINLGDIKRMKSTHMKRKMTDSNRVAKRSTLMETPSPTSAFITNGSTGETGTVTDECNSLNVGSVTHSPTPTPTATTAANNEKQLDSIVAPQQPIVDTVTSRTHTQSYEKIKPIGKFTYLAELSALNHFMVKHIAVLYLEELLKDSFTLEELADLIDDKKNPTLWGKFVTSLKTNKKPPKEGTFGVPLDTLVERSGTDSNLGAGPSRIRIPIFIDDSIATMRQMDMSVEGIFRKNGNIRRLKEVSEEIDTNPTNVQLMNEGPIQVAALTKKFLRELPEPLLTFKLHKLFTSVHRLKSAEDKKRALHLACCLLPKPNRDTLEVLFLFLKWVATFAQTGESSGSKMTLHNIATVLAPNVLYNKGKDPVKDDSFASIEAVDLLLQYQEEFCTVPEDIVMPLQSLSYGEDDMEASARDILRKCEVVMKLKKMRVTDDHFPSMPTRQHSSPPAINTYKKPPAEPVLYQELSSSPVDQVQPLNGNHGIPPTTPLPITTNNNINNNYNNNNNNTVAGTTDIGRTLEN